MNETRMSKTTKWHNSIPIYKPTIANDSIISISLVIKCGSREDGYNQQGRAHFVEHYLLCDDIITEGIWVKAKTMYDRTVYEILCRNCPNQIEVAFKVIDKISCGYYMKEINLENVRSEIIREYRIEQKKQSFQVYEMICKNISPSLYMPIGTIEAIRKLSFDQVKNYFDKYYIASNMAIFINQIEPRDNSEECRGTVFFDREKTGRKRMLITSVICAPIIRKEIESNYIKQIIYDGIFMSLLQRVLGKYERIIATGMMPAYTIGEHRIYKVEREYKDITKWHSLSRILEYILNTSVDNYVSEIMADYHTFFLEKINDWNYWVKYHIDCFVMNRKTDTIDDFFELLKMTTIDEVKEYIHTVCIKSKIYEYSN